MTEQELSVADSYFVIDTPVNLTSSQVVIGARSTLCFRGGKLVNDSNGVITLKGDDITIEAGPVQIFDGSFDFKSQTSNQPAAWTMERAYPQWFGANDCSQYISDLWADLSSNDPVRIANAKDTLDDLDDASTAINAAIKLKRRGEVLIPRGYYRLKHFVNLLPGIQLHGEGGMTSRSSVSGTVLFPWIESPQNYGQLIANPDTSKSSNTIIMNFDFPLHPTDVDWFNNGYDTNRRFGFLIAVCLEDTCTLNYKKVGTTQSGNPVYSSYPKSITYQSITGDRVVGTEISSISLIDIMSLGSGIEGETDHATMRGILTCGATNIRDVRMYGLSQLVATSMFGDQAVLDHCSFNDPVMLRGDGKAAARASLYPSKIYGFDVTNGGDAFVMHGCHAAVYNDCIGALKLRSCNGGSITGNILNSDVLIELCRGIDFAGNHMEYGATLTVATSAVSVRDNYIWRGTRPAITLRRFEGDAYNLSHWSAELSNNQLFWRSQHTAGEPQAAQSLYEFDIRTDGYGTLDIHNTFHTSSRLGPAEGSYFGLKMEWMEMHRYAIEDGHATEVGFSEETASKEPFEDFNRISHIASASSHIEGRNVTPMPAIIIPADFSFGRDCHTGDPIVFRISRHAVSEIDKWKKPDGVPEGCSYMYTAWIFADFKRKLFIPNPYPIASQLHPSIVPTPSSYQNQSQETMPDIGHQQGKYYNLRLQLGRGEPSNYDIPAGPYWMYIERSIWQPTSIQARQSVFIPVTSSCILWDDGEYLSGYKWEDLDNGTSRADEMESSDNLRPLKVTYHGRNVECLLPAAPQFDSHQQPVINGEWLNGDVIEWASFNEGSLIQYYYHNGMWYRK